ncbi:hypothetical protein [Kitasatospora sp. NPDC097643]|uniref:hypothetical protein n=1 Tax=Kitasatospora sp. NPDC097643 TaxID=3157230 RepID=UPI00331B6A00
MTNTHAGPISADDLAVALPAIAPYLRPATLLHPEAADAPDPYRSRIGGPALWPAGEPWPHCTARHLDDGYEYEEMPAGDTGIALLPVAQIRAEDAPHLPWPDGADLLQLLWCPNDHDDIQGGRFYYGPAVELRWRRIADLAPLTPPPPRRTEDDYYLPRPCVLHPEQIQDLPDRDELPAELHRAAEEFANRHDTEYWDLAPVDGWKAGGWPSWRLTDLVPVDCGACGTRMRHLFTVLSGDAPGVSVGRHGRLNIFRCPQDHNHPVGLDLQ